MPLSKKRKAEETLDQTLVEKWESRLLSLKKDPREFDPQQVAWWGNGERVPFIFLCLTFELISNTTHCGTITNLLSNMFKTVMATTPDDLLATVYLACNELAPGHEVCELIIDFDSIVQAFSDFSGASEEHVLDLYEKLGSLGTLARQLVPKTTTKASPLTLVKIYNTLKQMAKETAPVRKVTMRDELIPLFLSTRYSEDVYFTLLLLGRLRFGFSRSSVLIALGQAAVAFSNPPTTVRDPFKEAGEIVSQVFYVLPVIDVIVRALLSGGLWNLLGACHFTPGFPIRCNYQLEYQIQSVDEILNIFVDDPITCEYKYPGQRAQIHFMEDGAYEIFCKAPPSNCLVMFASEILSRLKEPSLTSCILDCVLVPFDKATMKIRPLQQSYQAQDTKDHVCIFAVDMLYLNGQLLLHERLDIRRQKLYDSFKEDPGCFKFATTLTSRDTDEIQSFFHASVDYGCEGIIITTLNIDATLEPPNGKQERLLLKKNPLARCRNNVYHVDSVNLVPIAAFHHSDNSTGYYQRFLLACYDAEKKEFQSICIVTTGFSEAMLEELSSSLRPKAINFPKQNYQVDDCIQPDVWFEPTEVWEVEGILLTISPMQRAAFGTVDPIKGISLEFPRLVRVRTDKKPEEATSSVQVVEMFNRINRRNEARGAGD